ncbi:hypothetical protein PPN31114_02351 [Pandoraea pneumonica]|uniref:Uncharacterized protein n=1 Tax=Pandoraea pneumonica TaxID=2508299 RepID=A0A5E4UZM8_9BURK|nr:hypothetical protein PPN31114_02351 [Pandoraea pneumonica]
MANKSLGTRQKLMFRGVGGAGGGNRAGGGVGSPAPRGIPPGRQPGSGQIGGRALERNARRKQRGTKTGGA